MVPRSSSLLRRWLHLALALLLVWAQTAAIATAAAQTSTPGSDRRSAERAAAFLRGIRKYRAALDAGRFDPAVLGRRFGEDWQAAYRFVRDEIALHPYIGTLRFARGTLVSRAGNACDRALLLGELLKAGGHRIRYAQARLDEAAIRKLAAHLDRPRSTTSRPLATDGFDPELLRLLVPAGLDEAAYRSALEESTATVRALAEAVALDTGFVRDRLAARLTGDRPPAAMPDVAPLLVDHCWVQMETAEGWRDLDPSLPDLLPGDRLAEPERVADSLPVALAPVLKLRLELMREQGGAIAKETILDAPLRMHGAFETASLLLLPELQRGEKLIGPALSGEYEEGFDSFVPVLATDSGMAVGEPFGADGRVLPTDRNARLAKATGEAIGGLFGNALGALGQALDEQPASPAADSRFAGIELVLELNLPDGGLRSSRRLLVPPLPEQDLRRVLPRSMDLLMTASRVSRELFLVRMLDALAAAKPVLRAALRDQNPDRLERSSARLRIEPLQLLEFAHLRAVFAEYLLAEDYPDLVAVPEEPLVVAYQRYAALREGRPVAVHGFDLVFDHRLLLPRDPGAADPARSREAASLLSILDNVLEHQLIGGTDARSGVAMLAAAENRQVPLALLKSADGLAALADLPPYARGLIEEALAEGYWVLAPERPVPRKDGPLFAFWRIEPRSGELLALGASGAGQAMAEYSQQIKLIALGTLVTCVVTAALGDLRSVRDFAHCLVIGMVVGVITAGTVGWLAGKLGWVSPAGQAMAEGAVGGAAGSAAGRLTGEGSPRNPGPGGTNGRFRAVSEAAERNLSGALAPERMAEGVVPRGGPVERTASGSGRVASRGVVTSVETMPPGRAAGTLPGETGPAAEPRTALARLAGPEEGGSSPGAARRTPAKSSASEAPKGIPSELHGQNFELATPTPKPPPAGEQVPPSLRKIEHFKPLVEAVEATNLPMQEIAKLKTLARAHRKIIVTRKVNPHARRWYEQGAVGKDINMKGKSASRGAIAGLIPEDQAFSKLYDKVAKATTPEERAKAWNKIAEYNAKVQEAVKKGDYEFVPFEVEGRKVGIYKQGEKVYQAYEKDGRIYDAATRKPIGARTGFERIKDLRVVGKKVDGETRYVTADIDLDYVIENPAAPEQPLIEWKPETGDTLGNRTVREEGLIAGSRNLSKVRGESNKMLHGSEQHNPFPEKLTPSEFPKLVVFDDGKVATLKNPYDQWKLLRDLKAEGYRIELSEQIREAYGWPEDWSERMPDAVRKWAPAEGDRPRRRRASRRFGRRPSRLPRAA